MPGADVGRVITAQQVHGTDVVAVDDALSATVTDGNPTCVPNADGLVTNRPGTALMALSADCPLVLVYDPAGGALGLAHAGWRGTLAGIAERLVACLTSNYGSAAEQMVATICPSAGPCCYEVGAEVVDMAAERWPEAERFLVRCDGRILLDLWSANAAQLQMAGLSPERIETPGLCSICDHRFHSYRRTGATTGHSGLMAALTP
ncbi:MAG: polyphenol oxidase family protein [Planctomycetes bacterium]|nr:polyphenol oxidase family protein [Planctomycetota bacterium]